MGVTRVRLLTNNPEKPQPSRGAGLVLVAVESLYAPSTPSNVAYLRAKRDCLGRTLPLDLTPA
jgi:3,4-dihydroxy 2-butanone 4-phosphate synthase/GTP cyclohydrolase II